MKVILTLDAEMKEAVILLKDIRFMEKYERGCLVASNAGHQYWGVTNYEEVKEKWLEYSPESD